MPVSHHSESGPPTAARRKQRQELSIFVLSEVRLYCEGLAGLLSTRSGLRVVGASPPGDAALAHITATQPRVVLVDSIAARKAGVVRQVAAAAPAAGIIAFALGDDHLEVLACADAGVAGFVAREASMDELVRVVSGLDEGEIVCSPRIATMMFRRTAAIVREHAAMPASPLTRREHEILALIDRAMTNKEIAAALSIQLTTVKHHVHHLLEKLGVRRRAAAAARLRSMDQAPSI